MRECTEIPGLIWFDDCPPPPHVIRKVPKPPFVRAKLAVELPPCQPHGGINTDWSGNKCSERFVSAGEVYGSTYDTVSHLGSNASANQAVLPTRKVMLEAPRLDTVVSQQPAPPVQADAGTVAQEPASGGDHASMFNSIGFYVAVALILALALVVVRNFLLNPFGGEEGVERDDA